MKISSSAVVCLALSLGLCRAQDVEVPPTIAQFSNVQDNFISVAMIDSTSIVCNAKGDPSPEVKWFKNEELIEGGVQGVSAEGTILRFTETRQR